MTENIRLNECIAELNSKLTSQAADGISEARNTIQKLLTEHIKLNECIANLSAELISKDKRLQEAVEENARLKKVIINRSGDFVVMARVAQKLKQKPELGYKIIDSSTLEVQHKKQSEVFNFDHIFGQGATQAEIFHTVAPFIEGVMDGFNACVIALGEFERV